MGVKKKPTGAAPVQETAAAPAAVPAGKGKEGFEVGDLLPDFLFETEESESGSACTLSLKEAYMQNGIVIFFYPKANTPGCTKQACGFSLNYEKLLSAGYTVLGMSADRPKSQSTWKKKFELKFHLLSDPDMKFMKGLGVAKAGKILRSHVIVKKGGEIAVKEIKISPGDSFAQAVEYCCGGAVVEEPVVAEEPAEESKPVEAASPKKNGAKGKTGAKAEAGKPKAAATKRKAEDDEEAEEEADPEPAKSPGKKAKVSGKAAAAPKSPAKPAPKSPAEPAPKSPAKPVAKQPAKGKKNTKVEEPAEEEEPEAEPKPKAAKTSGKAAAGKGKKPTKEELAEEQGETEDEPAPKAAKTSGKGRASAKGKK